MSFNRLETKLYNIIHLELNEATVSVYGLEMKIYFFSEV
jgi:hypothetical protein